MFRYKLGDLPDSLRIQAERQLSGCRTAQAANGGKRTAASRKGAAASACAAKSNVGVERSVPYLAVDVDTPKAVLLRAEQMSHTERKYQQEVLHGEGMFEPLTLKSPSGNRYTPDFLTVDDGIPTLHEVKGSYRLGSEGRAHTAFLEAASNFSSLFRFVWAVRTKDGGWDVKRVVEVSEQSKQSTGSSNSEGVA